MRLKNKYAFGLLIQWYEIGMIKEHIDACVQMAEGVENPENITFDFCISYQEYLEKIEGGPDRFFELGDQIQEQLDRLVGLGCIEQVTKLGPNDDLGWDDGFYNIASYRRDFNLQYCQEVDILCWSETDSLWPKQTLELLETLHENVKHHTPKYIVNFADRRLWDNSFAPLHPLFEDVPFQEDEGWQFNSPASGKGYMSLTKMNLINNIPMEDVIVESYNEPRFDGSCVCFSSDLIKSGINIPHSLLLAGEDTAMGKVAKKVLGDQFVQYCFKNILHVHNRRHPNKRSFILGENNPNGFCDDRKGEWWKILEDSSKQNLNNIFQQKPFIKIEDVLKKISK